MISYTALRERYLADRQAGAVAPGLADALEAIGWRSVGEPGADELAAYLVDFVEDCVTGHRDPAQLVSAIAHVLRDHGPLLDGGLPPAAAYEPAAIDILERWIRGESRRRPMDF